MVYTNKSVSDFDALSYEDKHSQDFERTSKQYYESNYEVDADGDWCGCVYRVWDGRVLLGTFYQKQKRWIANPYYKNREYLRLEQSLERTFNSNQRAINHIIRSYEGN